MTTNEKSDASALAADMAQLAAELFVRADSSIVFPVRRPELAVAAAGDTARAGLLAAAVALRGALCQSLQGRQALRDFGFEPVSEQVEGE